MGASFPNGEPTIPAVDARLAPQHLARGSTYSIAPSRLSSPTISASRSTS
jgi:hypothetical protein